MPRAADGARSRSIARMPAGHERSAARQGRLS
jgi:hypothetical protein